MARRPLRVKELNYLGGMSTSLHPQVPTHNHVKAISECEYQGWNHQGPIYKEEGLVLAVEPSKCSCVTKNRMSKYGNYGGWLAKLIEDSSNGYAHWWFQEGNPYCTSKEAR
jgi:hypothetical protein